MRALLPLPALCLLATTALAATAPTVIVVNAAARHHAISPLIYGVAFASQADLAALNAPLNRSGGNNTSTYNWLTNAQNLDNDYYFESYPQPGTAAGASVDSFISSAKAASGEAAITIPMIGYVAKLGANRTKLPSFSVAKYGPQCAVDPYDTDAGDGLHTDCNTPITGNNPLDAYVPDTPADEQAWVKHIVATFGTAATGGVPYYLMDNEASIWFSTHRDIHPVGPHGTEYLNDVIATSAAVKAVDKTAKVFAPEEWGWEAYFYSGYDQQYAAAHNYSSFPDHAGPQAGLDYIPWLLQEWKKVGRPVDVLSVHFYPQGGEYSNDDSATTQALRNRSTRQLWDTKYVSESWIGQPVYLIPRLKAWVKNYYYPGTPVAITEYNWGDEPNMNGATTQADLYGIFGYYGLNIATRWTTPSASTPTYKAMQMYRNYDGHDSTFGDTSVLTAVPDPDNLSAFAALRAKDGALTLMVINKIAASTPVRVKIGNFTGAASAQAFRLTSANTIQALGNVAVISGVLNDSEPGQSITLYVLPKG
jgi:hypothetical protein